MITRTGKTTFQFPTALAASLGRVFSAQAPTPRPAKTGWRALHSMRALYRMQAAWHWLLSKHVARRSSRELRLVETLSLGEKRFVATIEAGGARYLIGATAGQLSLLTRLDDQVQAKGPASDGATWEQP
jgi:flagellar biogenesis protein FliO